MKQFHVKVVPALAACLLLFACGPKLLSQKELLTVLEDMYRTEVAISKKQAWETLADTTQVYAAVFKKHKCSVETFRYSLDYYLTRPDKFRIRLQRLKTRLNEEREALDGELSVDRQRFMRQERYRTFLKDSLPQGPLRPAHQARRCLAVSFPPQGWYKALSWDAPEGLPLRLAAPGRTVLHPKDPAPYVPHVPWKAADSLSVFADDLPSGQAPAPADPFQADSLPAVQANSLLSIQADSLPPVHPDSLPQKIRRGVQPRILHEVKPVEQ